MIKSNIRSKGLISALVVATVFTLAMSANAEETRPNVLIFFIDDLGWTDIGVNGSTFYETPKIDALRGERCEFQAILLGESGLLTDTGGTDDWQGAAEGWHYPVDRR